MTYYLAPSLSTLREEINSLWPKRDKSSDGWIGDTAHSARKSDHNPDYSSGGVVRAIDVDKDGIDVDRVLAAVLSDPRVSYVIYNRRIWGGSKWRAYTGSNPHEKHIHISLKHTKAAEAKTSWGLTKTAPAKPASKPSTAKPTSAKRVLSKGCSGSDVLALQKGMNKAFPSYAKFKVDGKFGDYTVKIVKEFQRRTGLKADGVIGENTRAKLAQFGVKF